VPARLLVVGLDAAEATLIERWTAEGDLPLFARLEREGAKATLGNCLETIPGGVWNEIFTGRSIGRIGQFFQPRQLHTGEAVPRRIAESEVNPELYWWTTAAEAGLRVAAVDQPETVVRRGLPALLLHEWGVHSRNFGTMSEPPELLAEIRARHGDHPVADCDRHDRTEESYRALNDRLVDGNRRKTELLLDLLAREEWDLFACTYGETHCAGHQFWHFLDPTQPGHDPDAPAELRDAIRTVYRQTAEGVEQLVEAAGPGATVLLFASHGIGPFIGGYQLLPDVLVRLGLGSGGGATASVRTRLPRPVRAVVRRVVPGGARRRLQAAAGSLPEPLENPATKAIQVHNNRCGGIRLNLRGREPFGSVEPGAEADALVAELRRELLALEDPSTGEPIAVRVDTADELFGPDHHPDLPDVIVVFRTDLGPIEACRSERIGVVRRPAWNPRTPRSGDHTVESRLWAVGPGIEPGSRIEGGNVLDLAPTVLALLGVEAPADLDGRPLLSPAAV
jgi:predicted AlkP superfamily phosphohydrolase/phosphomutase